MVDVLRRGERKGSRRTRTRLLWSHGLETLAPGRHARGGSREIVLKHEAIHSYAVEVAGVYYVWAPPAAGSGGSP